MPGTGASTKGRRRTEERVYHRPFRDRVEQSAEIFLISLFCDDNTNYCVMGYRVRQGAHFYPVLFNALNLFELNDIAQGKQGNFEEPLTHIAHAREQDVKGNKSGLIVINDQRLVAGGAILRHEKMFWVGE